MIQTQISKAWLPYILCDEAMTAYDAFLLQNRVLITSFDAQMMSMEVAIHLSTCVTLTVIATVDGMSRTAVQVYIYTHYVLLFLCYNLLSSVLVETI